MKKVLFATTALILSAGFAAAEVGVTGDGRMGLVYDGNDTQFSSRVRVKFTLTGESDSGLSFGGEFRPHQAAGAAAGANGEIWVSGAYGKLAMGDVDSAAESAIGDLTEIGYTGLGFHNEFLYTASGLASSGNPAALYSYSAGPSNVYVSMMDGNGLTAYSIGANYTMGDSLIGFGYERNKAFGASSGDIDNQDSIDETILSNLGSKLVTPATATTAAYTSYTKPTYDAKTWVLGGATKFGTTTVKAGYAQTSLSGVANKLKQIGVGVDHVMGPTTVSAFVRQEKLGSTKHDYIGVGAEYDLGGGASVKGGIVDISGPVGTFDDTVADLGLKFKF